MAWWWISERQNRYMVVPKMPRFASVKPAGHNFERNFCGPTRILPSFAMKLSSASVSSWFLLGMRCHFFSRNMMRSSANKSRDALIQKWIRKRRIQGVSRGPKSRANCAVVYVFLRWKPNMSGELRLSMQQLINLDVLKEPILQSFRLPLPL